MGIEIDAGLAVDLGAKIGSLTDELRRSNQLARDRIPIDVRKKFAGVVPASGNIVLTGPDAGPEMGRVWLIRRCVISASLWSQSVGNSATAQAFATAVPSSVVLGAPPADELIDEFSSLPAVHYYSNRQAVVQNNENFQALILGATQGLNVVASIQAEDYGVHAIDKLVYDL